MPAKIQPRSALPRGTVRGSLRERGLSPASVHHVHAVLRGSLGQAVRWGWLPVNPGISIPAQAPPTRDHATGDDGHQRAAAGGRRAGPRVRCAAPGARRHRCAAWRGVRTAIVRHRHRRRHPLYIRRSVASVPGGTIVQDTKTHAARRIALDPATLAVLARHRKAMKKRAKACRVPFAVGGSRSRRRRRLGAVAPR